MRGQATPEETAAALDDLKKRLRIEQAAGDLLAAAEAMVSIEATWKHRAGGKTLAAIDALRAAIKKARGDG